VNDTSVIRSSPWYRSLNRVQWKALVASNLGWTFDGFEVFALILTVGVALRQLLDAGQYPLIPAYAGAVIAISVLGWAFGGLIGGVLADYIGRKRTMILAILAYSLMTGLSALSWDWLSFAVLRFLVGVAIGSEWATGASLMAELWPDDARGRGGAFLQCGFAVGAVVASGVWLVIGETGPGAWRYMYLVGMLPALLTFWIRRSVPESLHWEHSNERRRAARNLQRQGAKLEGEEAALARFTLVDLFTDRAVRPRLIVTLVMSLSVTIGYWGVSTWVPSYVASVATSAGLSGPRWAALAGLMQNVGAIVGYFSFGFLADAFGRKITTTTFYLMSLILTPIVYFGVTDVHMLLFAFGAYGFFVLGIFAWMPIWLPELFPTRLRATAAAFCFNAPRLISWIGPLVAGSLIVSLGGYAQAATIVGSFYILGLLATPFLPETKGKALPETALPILPLETKQLHQQA
jgi:MFS family permease